MLGTDPVLPLEMAVLELLGLLGPEPGALLHIEDTGKDTKTQFEYQNDNKTQSPFRPGFSIWKELWRSLMQDTVFMSPECVSK